MAYGSKIFVELEGFVRHSKFMQLLLADCVGEDSDEDTVSELLLFISRKYCRMRGRDYVRKLLARPPTSGQKDTAHNSFRGAVASGTLKLKDDEVGNFIADTTNNEAIDERETAEYVL